MFRIIQYGSAIVLGAILLGLQVNIELVNSISLILILIFGIPHGGVDHLIHTSTSSDTNVLRYILKYLMIAGAYILWWIIDPSKALLIFILLSAYHFGQEFVADMKIKGQNLAINLIWGALILIAPMIYSYSEIVSYLQIIIPSLTSELSPGIRYSIPTIIISLAIGSIIWLKMNQHVSNKKIVQIGGFLLMIIVSHLLLPFVQAFTIYFILFHSLNAFKHQFTWLTSRKDHYNIGKFIIDLIGFSALAILGILSLLWMLNPDSQALLITYFFILTSLITLPHAMTLDQFYRFRGRSKMTNAVTD